MNFSDYLEQKLLGHTLLQSIYTMPTTNYMALITSITTTGSEIDYVEVTTALGYERLPVDWSSVTSAPDTTVVNSTTLTWSPATTPWGGIVAGVIFDAQTIGTGNPLFWGEPSSVRTIETDDIFSVSAGQLTIKLD